ncbi:MAG: sulfotransferase [Myxococcales bacterium]|nr:sulfotransferase [Myxococcales bacterium]
MTEHQPGGEGGRLPSFLMIGAQECGTESLYWSLARHPKVVPAVRKEVHFFDRHFARGLAWYQEQFPSAVAGVITGEASPYYLFHPHVPERVRSAIPDARLIAILRDPVDRALHHFEHNRKKGHIDVDSFAACLDQEAEQFPAAAQRLLKEPLLNDHIHRHYSYIARGCYIDHLLQWERFFPRERFLILQAEAVFADPGPALATVVEFLGLPPCPELSFEDLDEREHDVLDRALRHRLQDFFRPFNRRLFDHIGREFDWD